MDVLHIIMDTKLKNYLAVAIVVAVFIFAFSAWQFVGVYSKTIEPSSFRSFSVSGEGKIVAIPDVAQFSFSVITQGGKNIAALLKENTEKVNKAIAFVKLNGVAAKDIETQSYNLEPRYQYFNCGPVIYDEKSRLQPCPPPEIVGFNITQSVAVKARDFGKVGDILSGVIENGANSVSQLSFVIDDPAGLQDQARAKAITKAQQKAAAIAQAAGFHVGRLLSIDEGGFRPLPFYRAAALEEKGGFGGDFAPAPPPTIEPGSQEVIVNVTLRYEIE